MNNHTFTARYDVWALLTLTFGYSLARLYLLLCVRNHRRSKFHLECFDFFSPVKSIECNSECVICDSFAFRRNRNNCSWLITCDEEIIEWAISLITRTGTSCYYVVANFYLLIARYNSAFWHRYCVCWWCAEKEFKLGYSTRTVRHDIQRRASLDLLQWNLNF